MHHTRAGLLRACLAALLLSAAAVPAAAQAIDAGNRITLRSAVLKEDRIVYVRAPRQATASARYPVLYLTDGEAQFAHTVATVDFLARNGRMPEVIVVGIANTDRTRDLTPSKGTLTTPDGRVLQFPSAGGADAFLEFITTELIPHIESRYPTAPYRIFAGHSFGGLFALHALVTRPETFAAYIAVSPTVIWDDSRILSRTSDLLRDQRTLKKTLVVTLGDEVSLRPGVEALQKRLESGPTPSGFVFEVQRFPDEDHNSVVLRSHYLGLRTIFDGWRLPIDPATGLLRGTFEDAQRHYARLTERFGYPALPPEDTINALGYNALEAKNVGEALKYFEWNVKTYPDSANTYDSLADALEADGKLEAARDRLQEAVRRGEANKDPLTEGYRQHLARVLAKLKA
jgi:predicted alpha/beta superfamily hydrolase